MNQIVTHDADDLVILHDDSEGRWTVEAMTARAKQELLEDVRADRVPATVESFSALHDHVDANEYGGITADDAPTGSWENHWAGNLIAAASAHSDRVEAMQNEVDRWIKDGGLLDALGAIVVYARITVIDDGEGIDREDVGLSVQAALHEIVVGTGATARPIVPEVVITDGPLS